MKKILLILFWLYAVITISAESTCIISDTLMNKGLNSYDSLIITQKDSLLIADSTINKAKVPAFVFIPSIGLDDKARYFEGIKNKYFSREDYRNLSDIFTYEAFTFNHDLGSLGQPNEQMFYGLGFGNISFIKDGVLINNRWQNSYNLNKLNNELVDSIEIAPITKGFLYSPYNNPISIIINNRYKFPSHAITNLKFYQASYDEGFVDVLFHAPINKQWSFGIGVSNSAVDSRFANSDYESWKLNAQVNYLVNDKININIDYSFSYDTLALFGGLDTNKILNDIYQTVLYETVSTSKSSRYQLTYNNQANVKILALLIPNIKSDLTFYFNSTSQKYFQNKDQLFENLPVIVHGNYYQTFGASFRNLYEQENISVDLIANYESTSFNTDVLTNNNDDQNILALSGEIKYLSKNEILVPSVFGKYSNFNGKTLLGFGADLTSRVNNNISFYAGFAWFQQQVTLLESNYPFRSTHPFDLIISYPFSAAENNSIEMGIKFNYNRINGKLTYFNYHSKNSNIPYMNQSNGDSLLINELSYFAERDIKNSGINANINLKIWNILFSNNFSYYLSTRDERVYASPDYTLAGKLYYMDLLFENNLNLKTGINYRYTGGQLPFIYDFEKSLQITSDLTPMVDYSDVPSSFQLDLFMAGTIQERATIFVTLENVLDTEYYIVPYYFKQPITLRFGVSWLLYD